jgi:hypothetical protein
MPSRMERVLARISRRKTRKVNEPSDPVGRHSTPSPILESSQPAGDKNQTTENTVLQNTALASKDAAQSDHPQDWIGM